MYWGRGGGGIDSTDDLVELGNQGTDAFKRFTYVLTALHCPLQENLLFGRG